LIEVTALTKKYGPHCAVDDISFSIEEGEIVGFLGPNGAGKTTTMNIMTGYISATAGDVVINGYNILDEPEKAKKNIGYLPELPPLYNEMRVSEYLNFVADLKRVKSAQKKAAVQSVMQAASIEDVSRRLIRNLSKGYKQRVGLAQAMLGDPSVIILDEPTVGLDPAQILEMRDVIRKLGKKHTVLLSSHILSEVSAVCDRVIIINRGRIVASDTPERLSNLLTQGNKIVARIKGAKDDILAAFVGLTAVTDIKFNESAEAGACDCVFSGAEDADIRESIFNCLCQKGLPLLMMKPLDLSLEDIFIQITSQPVRTAYSEDMYAEKTYAKAAKETYADETYADETYAKETYADETAVETADKPAEETHNNGEGGAE